MLVKESLLKNWSKAICELAVENKKTKEFLDTAYDLKVIFSRNPEFLAFLTNRNILLETRLELLDKVFKKDLDKEFLNILKLLTERGLIENAKQIFKQVVKDLLAQTNTVKGIVYSVEELNKKTIEDIQKKLEKKLNKAVILENEIRKELISGIRVVVDGQKYDSSMQGKIEDMKKTILQNRK
ncbi:F0F1 ATP synthase subunit delta [Spiroplasma chinense]|uniref:ATP synthase subunit delta n=1 Tax=Spiroplasma chinense TaxID=216932 RepID=A0A5B9Y2H9_9MOLU|nr:F0F1 ATP synthase subunit delta [Spiroplasma chinense]QEH61274.1 F0F1 ATP synthase subunit delta [Spiroplasma chinense]